MNYPFQSVLDGLTELHELMTNDTSAWQAWTDEFTTAYQFNKNAALVLEERMTADSPYHTLWIDGYTAVHGNSSFDAVMDGGTAVHCCCRPYLRQPLGIEETTNLR